MLLRAFPVPRFWRPGYFGARVENGFLMIPIGLAKKMVELKVSTVEDLIEMGEWSAGELAAKIGWKTEEVEMAIKYLVEDIRVGDFRNRRLK